MRRISCIDQQISWRSCAMPTAFFLGMRRMGVGAITDDGHHRERESHQRDVAMPAMPRAGFVVVEA